MITTASRLIFLSFLLGAATPSIGHHSFAAVFDAKTSVEVGGTVTKVEWMNPHAWIYLDTENEDGEVESWAFELGSPNGLTRRGWSRGTIKVGDFIVIAGYRARDGSLRANVISVKLPSGQQLDGMSSRPAAD